MTATNEGAPVVSGSIGRVLLDLCLAGGVEGGLLQILLQAADDLGVAVLHILAERLQAKLRLGIASWRSALGTIAPIPALSNIGNALWPLWPQLAGTPRTRRVSAGAAVHHTQLAGGVCGSSLSRP